MAKSFVITNRKKLDAFLLAGGKLEDVEIRVGQLTGKPKYPKGHVGSRSRQNRGATPKRRISRRELDRRSFVRAGRKQLEGLDKDARKAQLRSLRSMFKRAGLSSRTLGRRSPGRTPVARVAGVLHAGSAYHVNAIVEYRPLFKAEVEEINRVMHRGRPISRLVQGIGRNSMRAIKASARAAGHFDTGKLIRNTRFELRSMSGFAEFKRQAKVKREFKKLAKRAAKRRARADFARKILS